jgi:hypothetical protein
MPVTNSLRIDYSIRPYSFGRFNWLRAKAMAQGTGEIAQNESLTIASVSDSFSQAIQIPVTVDPCDRLPPRSKE